MPKSFVPSHSKWPGAARAPMLQSLQKATNYADQIDTSKKTVGSP